MSHEGDQIEQHGLQPMQYVQIGIVLTVITVLELGASLWIDIGDALLPVLAVLSGVKFAMVIMLFMHLRFDDKLFARIFLTSLTLGAFVLFLLLALFRSDRTVL
ncbi:MAG: cytochrome C oxidase subunit IV family protein [Dehalococcoidia bacterium]